MKKLLIIGAALMLLASCQKHFEEEHLKYDATKSKALNIALLTGLTTVENGPIVDSEPVGHSSNGGQGAAMTAGAFDLLTGGGGLGLTTAFLFKIYQPEWENHVFAWMPQDMAKDEAEAASVMCNIMYKAVKKVSPNNGKVIQDKPCYNFRAWSDAKGALVRYISSEDVYTSFNPQVEVPDVVPASFLINTPSYYWSYMKTSSDTSPHIRINTFYEEVALTVSLRRFERLRMKLSEVERNNIIAQTYVDLSSNLPPWVYIYIAPNPKAKTLAYFLNKGKKLYFIKPTARGEG
jgi:hypothetical protein